MDFMLKIIIRSVLAVVIGIIIGSERARHGRAAGARTHILVSLGAALTAMISIYANDFLGYSGDIFRLSAQVISGVGFLGAGVIILKSNNVITGLTTAAGVWTTSVIGIAAGCGFYFGAIVISVLYMITISLLGKLERRRNRNQEIYIEIDDMYKANEIVEQVNKVLGVSFNHRMMAPKSNMSGNLGITLIIDRRLNLDIMVLKEIEHVVFVEEES